MQALMIAQLIFKKKEIWVIMMFFVATSLFM
jgi:hypothetical protein